ncbi:MAG: nucleotidyltransferase domain-containing protein [DPANN group archaeon]|nr:nucleotidyltransferase domain-containing protein [DPANN group archaeon]
MVKVEFIDGIFEQFLPDLKKKFTIRKLSLLTQLSYDAVYRHVHHLINEGAFKEGRVGAYSYIGLNMESNLARNVLERISLNRAQGYLKKDVVVQKLLGEIVRDLEKAIPNELLSVVLYGSYAKGTETDHSDVDLLIMISNFEVREKVERVCLGVEKRYGKDIAPLITTATEFKNMLKSEKPMVAQEILLDAVILYGYEKYYATVFEAIK